MTNIFFPNEKITEDDLYFVCYMIERIARRLHQKNQYIVEKMGKDELVRMLSLANVLHCENPLKVESDWIEEYGFVEGNFYIEKIDSDLTTHIPTEMQMGKVYMRLIIDTLKVAEDYAEGLIRVYNNPICEIIDNYNSSAYYEPSYVIARAYNEGGF